MFRPGGGLLILALGLALGPQAAHAAGELNGVRVMAPQVSGQAAWGTAAMGKELRKQLRAAGAKVISGKVVTKAIRAARLKPGASPEALAEVGKKLNTEYVLKVRITKKGWLFEARALLIDSEDGQVKMDFTAGYYKPKEEAKDRGLRISKKVVEKLLTMTDAAAPPPAPEPPPEPQAMVSPPPEPPARAVVPVEPAPKVTEQAKPREPAPSQGTASFAPAARPAEPQETRAEATPSAKSTVTTEVTPLRGGGASDLIRATLTGGSGLLHSFNASLSGKPSTLSYQLEPLSLIAGDIEVLVPSVGLGVIARGAFSPLRLKVNVGSQEATPGGTLLDLAFGVRAHFALGGTGRETTTLVPAAGLRLTSLRVVPHLGDIVHSSRSIAPFLGLELRYPPSTVFELLASAEGGIMVSYSESPVADGQLAGGYLFGAGLGARVWITDALGIAFDGRFDLTAINLTGQSDRQPQPPGENLVDLSLSTRDLRLSLGLALRI